MRTECKQATFEFHGLFHRKVKARFDGGKITSDAGVLLLREVEQRTGLVAGLTACFRDHRDPRLIEHTVEELLGQRIYGLCLGYEDLNDHDQLRTDPMLAVAVDKADPLGERRRQASDRGKALAGRCTLNRLELTAAEVDEQERYKKIAMDPNRIDGWMVDAFVESHESARKGPGQQLVEHVHSLIYTVAVALAQEADQRRPASRERQIAQTVGGTVADVSKKSPLIIPVEPLQVHAEHSCRLDQRQSLGEQPHRSWGRLGWVLLDSLEPGCGLARLHFQQLVERLTNLRRKLFGNPRGDCFSRLLALLPDDPPQHRLGREHSSFLFEILPCSGEQCGGLFQPTRLFVEELLQASCLVGVKAPQPEILLDSDLVSGDPLLPGCVVAQTVAVDAGLQRDEAQQLFADLERLLNRETLEDPHKAQLICEAQALRIPATLGDLRQVCLGQGRVVDQLASRRKNHGHVSIIMSVLIDDI